MMCDIINVMKNKQFQLTLSLIAVGAASRLLPHPPNVTPVAAMALLGGTFLEGWASLLLPLAAMLASDLLLGFHATMPFVYGAFLATAWMGRFLKNGGSGRVLGACLASSLLFFIVTNLGVWITSGMYPRDLRGLAACYAAAVPFFRNSALADVAFTGLLFSAEGLGLKWFAARPAVTA